MVYIDCLVKHPLMVYMACMVLLYKIDGVCQVVSSRYPFETIHFLVVSICGNPLLAIYQPHINHPLTIYQPHINHH